MTSVFKSSGRPYVRDVCPSGPFRFPWRGGRTRSPEPYGGFVKPSWTSQRVHPFHSL